MSIGTAFVRQFAHSFEVSYKDAEST